MAFPLGLTRTKDCNDGDRVMSQHMPSEGTVNITPLVIKDLETRAEIGLKAYGRPLQANNGRDALWDAYEEALDLCQYLRQAIEEQNNA